MIAINDIRKYLELQLDLFILLKVPHKHLTKKPRQVFIEHILCQIDGIDINSSECIERVRDKLEFFANSDVWGYRWRLHKAGWLRKEGDKYSLLPLFNLTKDSFKKSKTYNFTISYEETNKSRQEGNRGNSKGA